MANKSINIIAVGDIMPGGVLANVDSGYIDPKIQGFLQSGDIRVGTLETAIGNEPAFNPTKMEGAGDVIYALDHDLNKVRDLGFDLVSLANNHFFDLGVEGARHTIDLLDQLGICHIGAGNNLNEASKPAVFNCNGAAIAFLAFCDTTWRHVGWCPFADDTMPGVNPMNPDHVVSEISKCAQQYDYVVVMPHWGKEHISMPTDEIYRMSQLMRKAGADLILGSHTHSIQPIYRTKGTVIAYSMGNFLFPDRIITAPRSTYYPQDKVDLSALPVTERFPKVTTLTFKRWKESARYGVMISTTIGGQHTEVKSLVTHLTSDNYLEAFSDKYPGHTNVLLSKWALQSQCYPLFYLPKRFSFVLKRFIRRFIHI